MTQKRLEIQGIRIVGAILVSIFHIFQWGVSGGVDVFFTISGFFLYSSVISLVENGKGYFQYCANFFTRNAPQALITVACTGIVSLLLLSPLEWRSILQDAAFSAIFFQNYWLLFKGQDYFAGPDVSSILRHYWAVSVIAQVYFLFLCFAFIARIISCGRTEKKIFFNFIILIAGIVSLAWYFYASEWHERVAYFDTFARMWQFCMGALLAYILKRNSQYQKYSVANGVLSWAGLLLIVSCGFLFGKDFPGFPSLWATVGALLILGLAKETNNPLNAGSLLSNNWISSLGKISYGVYLWHYPTFAIYARFNPEQTILSALLIVAFSGVMALIAVSLVAYINKSLGRMRCGEYGLAALSIIVIVLLGLVALVIERGIKRNSAEISKMNHPVQAERLSILGVTRDNPIFFDSKCNQTQSESPELFICSFGNVKSHYSAYLIGGSHSAQWLPAFIKIAEKENFHLKVILKNGCRFFDPSSLGMSDYLSKSCRDWNMRVKNYIIINRPNLVIALSNTRGDKIVKGISDAITNLSNLGIDVVAMRDTPDLKIDPAVCSSQAKILGYPKCLFRRDKILNDDDYKKIVKSLPEKVILIDMNDEICPDQYCRVKSEDAFLWFDSHHITEDYALALTDKLWGRIASKLRY